MALASRAQRSPIEAVVEMLRRVVEYRSRGSSDQVLEARIRRRRPRDQTVQVVDVCAVMLPPVVLEGLRGDVRHQGVMGVGQCGQDMNQFGGLLEAVPRRPLRRFMTGQLGTARSDIRQSAGQSGSPGAIAVSADAHAVHASALAEPDAATCRQSDIPKRDASVETPRVHPRRSTWPATTMVRAAARGLSQRPARSCWRWDRPRAAARTIQPSPAR